jgi:hypothetical protein
MQVINKGEIPEVKFLLEAIERGLKVSRPCFDSYRYDFIVDNDKRRFRVQVKSTTVPKNCRNTDTYAVSVAHGSKRNKKYTSEDVDFFAIYIIPKDTWFIIPIWAIDAVKVSMIIGSKLSKYSIYQDNWEVLL